MPDLLATIDSFDKATVLFVQDFVRQPWLDPFMQFITNSRFWAGPILLLLIWLFFKGGKKGRIAVVLFLPLFFLSDFCTAKLLKPVFARPRPLDHAGWSLPSVHAANSFAFAALFSVFNDLLWPKFLFYSIAVLVALSRVYLGVHYPTDILAGALWGSLAATLLIFAYLGAKPWLERTSPFLFDYRPRDERVD